MTRKTIALALLFASAGAVISSAWTGCKDDSQKSSARMAARPAGTTGPTTAEVLYKPPAATATAAEDPARDLVPIPPLGETTLLALPGKPEKWNFYRNGLGYQILKPGTGAVPLFGQLVAVHYVGTHYENGEIFDQSAAGTPFAFQLGTKGIIAGWNMALSTMHVGEKTRFLIPAPLAYGKGGSLPKIMPNEALVFEITLADVSGKPVPMPAPATLPATTQSGPPSPPATYPAATPR